MNESSFNVSDFFAELREEMEVDPTTDPLDWRFGFEGEMESLQGSFEKVFATMAVVVDDEEELGGEMHQSEDPEETEAFFVAVHSGTMTESKLSELHDALERIATEFGVRFVGVDAEPFGSSAEDGDDDEPTHQDAIAFVEEVIGASGEWKLDALETRAEGIRATHLQALEEAGLQAADWMPTIAARFPAPTLRPHEEICRRLMAATVTTAWIFAPEEMVSGEHIQSYIGDNGIAKRHFSERELGWMQMKRDKAAEDAEGQGGWITENIWSLAWLIGGAPTPTFHNQPVSGEILTPIRADLLGSLDVGLEELVEKTNLQPIEAVLTLEDLLYCAHNALRTIALQHEDVIAVMGYVQERRQSLTWALTPEVAWDETDVST